MLRTWWTDFKQRRAGFRRNQPRGVRGRVYVPIAPNADIPAAGGTNGAHRIDQKTKFTLYAKVKRGPGGAGGPDEFYNLTTGKVITAAEHAAAIKG